MNRVKIKLSTFITSLLFPVRARRARVELRQYDEKEITGFHPGSTFVSPLTYATPPPLGQVIRTTRLCSLRNSVFILFPVETDYYPRTTNIRRTIVIFVPKPSDTISQNVSPPTHTHPPASQHYVPLNLLCP